MPRHKRVTDRIIGRGLLAAETVSARLRKLLARRLSRSRGRMSSQELLDMTRQVLRSFEPHLAMTMADTELAAWVGGVEILSNKTPQSILKAIQTQFPSLYPKGGVASVVTSSTTPESHTVTFPGLERSLKSLSDREVVTRRVFDQLSDEAKQHAFTVAYQESEKVIDDVRQSVYQSIETGGTIKEFERDIEAKLVAGAIGPAHLETVYRTNVMQAFGRGQELLASNDVMQTLFPYAQYNAIDDGRVRSTHLDLESLGIQGTNIYRSDDPMWYYFTPPWGYNCLLPGTRVHGVIGGVRRIWYEGKAIELVTKNGSRVSLTANHPVLTSQGFVPACEVTNGQYVFGDPAKVNGSAAGIHKQNKPPTVEQVFQAASLIAPLTRRPFSGSDFHGDGRSCKGNVDVVFSSRPLLFTATEQISQLMLILANSRTVQVRSDRPFSLLSLGPHSATTGVPRRLHLARDILSRASGPLDEFSLRSASPWDARFGDVTLNQAPADSKACLQGFARLSGLIPSTDLADFFMGNVGPDQVTSARRELESRLDHSVSDRSVRTAEAISQLADGSSGFIKSDQVVSVRKFHYSGHVYDLETENGLIGCNSHIGDGIMISNCRCGKTMMTLEQAAAKGIKEAIAQVKGKPFTPEHRLHLIEFRPEGGFVGPGVAA
jgi:hypothetical protein